MAAVPKFHPTQPAFKTLSIFEKYEAVAEALDLARRASVFDPTAIAQLEELWLVIRARAAVIDPYWDMEHHLWLADENRQDMLFSPRRAQRKIGDYIYAARADKKPQHPHGRPVRLYLPKARRIGISQIIAAIFYLLWRDDPHTFALVLAHRKDSAGEIFAKYRRFFQRDVLAPVLDRESTTELICAPPHSSELHVITGGVVDSSQAQAFGWTLFHVSEAAHLRTNNPHALLSGIYAAMPSPSASWSCAVEESTGKTINGPFYDTCKVLNDIQNNGGDRDEELAYAHMMFLPACERDTARLPFQNEKDRARFVKSMTDEEMALLDVYRPKEDMTEAEFLEFLNWRRYEYKNNIKGTSEAEKKREMRRQHPNVFTDCFAASGGNAFDLDRIDHLMITVSRAPVFRGDMAGRGPMWSEFGGHVQITPKAELKHSIDGPLHVWERPKYGCSYSMGVDASRGTEAGDFDVIMVFNRTTRKFVAMYRARVKNHDLTVRVRLISAWYKNAVINVESNVGAAVIERLALTDRREFLYKRKNQSGVEVIRRDEMSYGTYMTNPIKVQYVSRGNEKIEHESGMFLPRILLEEMRDYQEKYNAETDYMKYGTAKGKHDDVFMASQLALDADEDMRLPAGTLPDEQWHPPTPLDAVKKFEEGQSVEHVDLLGEMEMLT